MKKLLLTTVSVIALSNTPHAADLAPAYKTPAYAPAALPNWAGAYIGIQGGVARHDATFSDIGDGFSLNESKTGGTVGGHAGYNLQHRNFVYGIEADWSWLGTEAGHGPTPRDFSTASSYDVSWLATIRGRAGLAVDATLLYVTGGLAFGKVKNSLEQVDNLGVPFFSQVQDDTKVGWTAGFGIEHMFSPNWTARAEFRYVDLGKSGGDCKAQSQFVDCSFYRSEFSNTLMMGLVGLDYKF